jgi:tetratricopeptide (TPR) repeat protein/tRNA A-37 threonylcarbamoyl transferase component Bud32
MGAVWLAQQAQPRRLVALKTIRPELLSARLRERFDHEARFLAALDHPAIARIHEAGSSIDEAGRETPWLAMEYVQGLDLLSHASRKVLGLTDRLHLLIAVGEGVMHAHTRGIMHRDLKPANVLVTADGQPKILDFGIARALSADGPAATRLTRIGEVIGTVEYMSPEQLSGDPAAVDARADVYALGVIAFELLTGKLPHELGGCSLIEAIQRIQHQPPQRLSQLRPEFTGDLDTVVMKALAADPQLRYQSVAAFIDDLRAWIEHRPIRARPPSTFYLLRKWVRRNRLVAVAAVVALLSLLGATVFSLLAADAARRALAEAQARTHELQAVNEFVGSMLTEADPDAGGSSDQPLSEVLTRAEQTLDAYADRPRTRGQVAALLGRTWMGLGDQARAGALLDTAIESLRAGFGVGSAELIAARTVRAEALGLQGETDAAALQLQQLLKEIESLPQIGPALRVQVITALAQVIQTRGEAAQAISMLKQAELDLLPSLSAQDADTAAGLRYNLAYALLFAGDFKEAETRLRAVVADESSRLGASHPQTLYSIKGLGQALHRQGRLDEAVAYYQQVYEQRLQLYGSTHPATLNATTQLAAAFNTLKRGTEAEPLLRAVISARETRGEHTHPQMIAALNILATTLGQQERYAEAQTLVHRALDSETQTGPNQETLASRNILATVLQRSGDPQAALAQFDILLQQLPAVIGKDHINYAVFTSNAAACDLQLGRKAQAREKLEEVLPMLTARFGAEHPRTQEAAERLAQALAP